MDKPEKIIDYLKSIGAINEIAEYELICDNVLSYVFNFDLDGNMHKFELSFITMSYVPRVQVVGELLESCEFDYLSLSVFRGVGERVLMM